jgi:hypothetical protein
VPVPSTDRESHKLRLLRLLLLQIAILSITSACAGGHRSAYDGTPPATPAPRPRLHDSRAVAESLKESLDAMSDRMATTGMPIAPAIFAIDDSAVASAVFPDNETATGDGLREYTATSALDTGRLPEGVR